MTQSMRVWIPSFVAAAMVTAVVGVSGCSQPSSNKTPAGGQPSTATPATQPEKGHGPEEKTGEVSGPAISAPVATPGDAKESAPSTSAATKAPAQPAESKAAEA